MSEIDRNEGGVAEEIVGQLEYYLSDWNLRKDEFLQAKIKEAPGGWIHINTFFEFPRLQNLYSKTIILPSLKLVAKNSKEIEANISKKLLRRRRPFQDLDKQTIDKRTVYVEGFIKPYTTAQSIKSLFENFFGKILFVNPYYDLEKNHFHGFAFIEFYNDNSATSCVTSINKAYNNEVIDTINLDELKNKLPNLRAWKKTDWEKLKMEYLNLQTLMQREIKRPFQIKDSSIIRVHGIHPESTVDTLVKLIAKKKPVDYVDHEKGSIFAYLIFQTPKDASKASEYFENKELYHKNSLDSKGSPQTDFNINELAPEKKKLTIGNISLTTQILYTK
ncbi:hypothetical protein BB558_003840 [Smittium angustum]|uniref:HTH La-type RNA-binding domain-containing protein n=1 Tax=Smittium angustum TaxID=133377 RepID=A0A2U1J529_SMIAN|nr:hypothetical protein BB558_003840 [Smittium angustum]